MKCPYCGLDDWKNWAGNTDFIRAVAHLGTHGWNVRLDAEAVCLCCGWKPDSKGTGCVTKLAEHLRTCEPFLHLRCCAELGVLHQEA